MNKDEMIKIQQIEQMAIMDCQRVPRGTKCADCSFARPYSCNSYRMATKLYNAGVRIVGEDEIVIKKSELARLKNLEINYEQVYEDYRKLEQERKNCRLIADDEIVIKQTDYVELNKDFYDWKKEYDHNCLLRLEVFELEKQLKQAEKETAREILKWMDEPFTDKEIRKLITEKYGIE